MDKETLLKILDKNIDQEGLAKDLTTQLILPILEQFVKDTANPYDDKLIEYIKAFIAARLA
jgi:hypothetical protein